MLSLGPLAFALPWVLTALATLPLLWLLLRVIPPAPKRVVFPALALLLGLNMREETPRSTPWWLILLRLTIAAQIAAALAAADPDRDAQFIAAQAREVTDALLSEMQREWDTVNPGDERAQHNARLG